MRILIGTMFSGENEFEECLAAIRRQEYSEWEHFTVENLPNQAAHDKLYRTFMERAGEFDLFMKVDADMVLEHPDVLARIAAWFGQHPRVDCLSIKVFDWFTQQHIDGMHTFSHRVTWPPRDDPVFTDNAPNMKIRVADDRLFLGAVSHAKNPTPLHAFRFGVHKAWKARAAFRSGGQDRRRYGWLYLKNIARLWRHQRRNKDDRLVWSCLGVELMLAEHWPLDAFDYNGDLVRGEFQVRSRGSTSERLALARSLKFSNRWKRAWWLRGVLSAAELAIWRGWQSMDLRVRWLGRRVKHRLQRVLPVSPRT